MTGNQQQKTILMVPGYNEPPAHLEIIAKGKAGIAGLDTFGLHAQTFPQQDDHLRDRIDRFSDHLDKLKNDGVQFPIVTLGYSLGGLVVRGFLRAYPERQHLVSHTIMIGTPNWGVTTLSMPHITRLMRVPDQAMGDMDIASDFMRWLNGTGGHWKFVPDKRHRLWELDREPIVGPADSKMLSITGLVPKRGGDNDGLVWADSATLGERLPTQYIRGPHANHMNLIGHFDILIMLSKGFLRNNKVWPLTVAAIARFAQS
ncbi:MAG: alpha/beta hydrolase [Candidatus Eremiobacteraeota bacterium]|nr:alpha/beta hydrolase [Candidatus Eremiobacteraeota bacterium]